MGSAHFLFEGLGCKQGHESVMVANTLLAFLHPGSGYSELGRPRVLPFTHLTSTHCPHLFVFCSFAVLMAAGTHKISGFLQTLGHPLQHSNHHLL